MTICIKYGVENAHVPAWMLKHVDEAKHLAEVRQRIISVFSRSDAVIKTGFR
jgi:hypothetical protein